MNHSSSLLERLRLPQNKAMRQSALSAVDFNVKTSRRLDRSPLPYDDRTIGGNQNEDAKQSRNRNTVATSFTDEVATADSNPIGHSQTFGAPRRRPQFAPALI
jgi:hypothetical protein